MRNNCQSHFLTTCMHRIEACEIIARELRISQEEAAIIVKKSEVGKEFSSDSFSMELWLRERFLPNIVFIDESGYAKMCIDALKILKSTVATDYGSSRQRDLGQLWSDMTRGYLAEYAFLLFLQKNWDIKAELGHEQGNLQDYLPADIHKIQKNLEPLRDPKIKIGIKGTKWNGIWFDIPGAQFDHSDIHVLVKVGTNRDHLFAYFKHISVFRDKILKKGIEIGAINQQEADSLFENLPLFQPIPAYIAGFAVKDVAYEDLAYTGKKGRMHFNVETWKGEIKGGDLQKIKEREEISARGKVKFEGIGSFSHESGYLFNVGNLLWKKEDWETFVINRL